jgi:hypothetical protein
MGDDPLVAQHTGRYRAWESSHITHFLSCEILRLVMSY